MRVWALRKQSGGLFSARSGERVLLRSNGREPKECEAEPKQSSSPSAPAIRKIAEILETKGNRRFFNFVDFEHICLLDKEKLWKIVCKTGLLLPHCAKSCAKKCKNYSWFSSICSGEEQIIDCNFFRIIIIASSCGSSDNACSILINCFWITLYRFNCIAKIIKYRFCSFRISVSFRCCW